MSAFEPHASQTLDADTCCSKVIDASIQHFETQESPAGQMQHVRALYTRALAYEVAGKKRLQSITMGMAHSALSYLYEELGRDPPSPSQVNLESLLPDLPIGFQ